MPLCDVRETEHAHYRSIRQKLGELGSPEVADQASAHT